VRSTKLIIRQFRNIADVTLTPHPILNLLLGDNGQGKTSLIEALYYLSTLRSFRTGQTADLIQIGKDGFLLEAEFEEKDVQNHLKIKIEEKKRKLILNEKPVGASRFTANLRTVVFSPESLGSIKSGPESRRELIDQATFQISERAALAQIAFSKALRQRNSCLRQIRDGEIPSMQGLGILESLDPLYIHAASEVIDERLIFLEKIFGKIEEIFNKITGETSSVTYAYKSSRGNWDLRHFIEIQNRLRDELMSFDRRASEMAAGVTLTGPHRHEINFVFNGNDSRIFCSQGQQRAVILAFKIAEIVYHNEAFHSYPILLLDDVLSEFDDRKRNFLIEFLKNNEAQTFLTTTDQIQIFRGSKIFDVTAGKISSRQ
jgi:DNA replication and repair protein RecF